MCKPRMLSTRIDEVSKPKLMDSPESLKLLSVNYIDEPAIFRCEIDQVVDGITEDFGLSRQRRFIG